MKLFSWNFLNRNNMYKMYDYRKKIKLLHHHCIVWYNTTMIAIKWTRDLEQWFRIVPPFKTPKYNIHFLHSIEIVKTNCTIPLHSGYLILFLDRLEKNYFLSSTLVVGLHQIEPFLIYKNNLNTLEILFFYKKIYKDL